MGLYRDYRGYPFPSVMVLLVPIAMNKRRVVVRQILATTSIR